MRTTCGVNLFFFPKCYNDLRAASGVMVTTRTPMRLPAAICTNALQSVFRAGVLAAAEVFADSNP